MTIAEAVAKFFGKLEQADIDEQRKSALGWTVLNVDTEGGGWHCPFSHGLFSSPEDALLAAITMEENAKKWGDEGWEYIVIPILPI